MRIKVVIKWAIIVLFALTFLYQYMRIDKNVSRIAQFRSKSESVTDHTLYVNDSVKFSNEILEGTLHGRSVLYFQTALLIMFILLEINLRNKSPK